MKYVILIFLLFIIVFWVCLKIEVSTFEENIKRLLKNINRKNIEVGNILSQVKILISDQTNAESKIILDSLMVQNPNHNTNLATNLVLVQLNNLRNYVLPDLKFNESFNNYYSQIVRLETEITALISEKDKAIQDYNIAMKNPVYNLFGYNSKNKIDFDAL